MFFSLAGSFIGGAVASRVGLYRALVGFAIARTAAIGAIVWLSSLAPGEIGDAQVVLAKGVEELAGGALTTAMFAFMMSRVDRRIGATHYTLLAGVEVFGKVPGGLFSGMLADTEALGFSGTFAIGLGLSLLCLPLLLLIRPRAHTPGEPKPPQTPPQAQ